MVTLLIIADDFTGALDTGVKFAQRGAGVRVITDCQYSHQDYAGMDEQTEVLVVDAETRHISSREAYGRVYGIVAQARKAGIPFILKKTDSALRGNIGSELTAVLDASGGRVLHFLPAFPQMRRTTDGGCHYIDGVPVAQSVFGQDPFEPVVSSDIAEIIGSQSDIAVELVSGGEIVTAVKQPTIAVYDAKTDEDLQALVDKLAAAESLELTAGCAGIAERLPGPLGIGNGNRAEELVSPGLFVACGSVNPITRAQLDYAEQHGFERIYLTPQQKLEPGYFETEAGQEALERIVARVLKSNHCILDTNDRCETEKTLDYAARCHISTEELRVRIAETLGYLVGALVKRGMRKTLLVTGGDSLLGFLNQVGVSEMAPVSEIAPGTVFSRMEIEQKPYEIISKSGGFGEVELMVKLAQKINREYREEEG